MKIVLIAPPGPEGDSCRGRLAPRLPLESLPLEGAAGREADVYWIHRGPNETSDPQALDPEALAALGKRVERGARVLLTGPAALLVGALALEEELPELGPHPGLPGPRGVIPFLDHPLFRRFRGGVLLREVGPDPGVAAFYPAGRGPRRGILTGAEKTLAGCDATRFILFEHRRGRGRILSLGAHLAFAHEDSFAEHRLRFAGDMVDYLMDDARAARAAPWPGSPPGVRVLQETRHDPGPLLLQPAESTSADELVLEAQDDPFFDLVSPEGLVCAGGARNGIEGVWLVPVRVLERMKTSFLTADGRRFRESDPGVAVAITRRRHHVERRFALGPTQVTERITPARSDAAAGLRIEWKNHGPFDLQLELECVADQRLAEPYPEGILSPLELRTGPSGSWLTWTDEPTGTTTSLHVEPAPLDGSIHDLTDDRVSRFSVLRRLPLPAGGSATALLLSGPLPAGALAPGGGLVVSAGDPELDEAIRWCDHGLASLLVATRLGRTGVLAGIGPGGPFFGGSDALWATRALIPLGHRDAVEDLLSLFAEHIDPAGRVFERMTASMVPGFGSVEPSLLFVDAADRLLAWTGDVEAARALWPAVRRAMRCVADLLPEDPPHAGAEEVSLVTCSLLARALASAARLASLAGDEALASAWAARAGRVVALLDHTFLDASAGRYAWRMRGDGSVDFASSAAGAVPVLLGICPEELAARVMEPFARGGLAQERGVSSLGAGEPGQGPEADAAAVSMLVTGQVASAEFAAGRPDVAFHRVSRMLATLVDLGGVLPDVLRAGQASGSADTQHAAASQAAPLAALATGLLGAGPGEEPGSLELAPALPGSVDRVAFAGLRFLDHEIEGEVVRGQGGAGLTVTLRKKDSRELVVELEPFVPGPCEVAEVRGPGGSLPFQVRRVGEGIRAGTRIVLAEQAEVFFAFVPDLLVGSPLWQRAGAPIRIVARTLVDADTVELELEAPHGDHRLPVRFPSRVPTLVEGGEPGDGWVRFRVEERSGGGALRPVTLRFCFAEGAVRRSGPVDVGAGARVGGDEVVTGGGAPRAEGDVAEGGEERVSGGREPPGAGRPGVVAEVESAVPGSPGVEGLAGAVPPRESDVVSWVEEPIAGDAEASAERPVEVALPEGATPVADVTPVAGVGGVEPAIEDAGPASVAVPPAEIPHAPERKEWAEPTPGPEHVLEGPPELEEWTEPARETPPLRMPGSARRSDARPAREDMEPLFVSQLPRRNRGERRQLVYAFVILAIGLGLAGFVLFGPRGEVVAGSSSTTRSASADTRESAKDPAAAATTREASRADAATDPGQAAPLEAHAAPEPVPAVDTRDLLKTFTLHGLHVEDLLLILGPPSAGVPPGAVRYEFPVPIQGRLLVWSDGSREVFAAEVLGR